MSLLTFDPDGPALVSATEVIAQIPVVLPPSSWFDWPQTVRVSRTGWVALSFRTGPNHDEAVGATMFVDVLDPEQSPWIVEADMSWSAWGPDDQMLVIEPVTSSRAELVVRVFRPADRTTAYVPTDATLSPIDAWLADGSGMLATRTRETSELGVLTFDGVFSPLDPAGDLPPLYAATGVERPAGRGLLSAGVGCDATGTEASGGCVLAVYGPDAELLAVWGRAPSDQAWDHQGEGLWTVTTGAGPGDGSEVTLARVSGPDAIVEIGKAQVDRPSYAAPEILGISDEGGPETVVLVGEDNRLWAAFTGNGATATFEGDDLFAGWAGDPGVYDPAGFRYR